MPNNTEGQGRSNRGFAAMDADQQREIASKGGRAAHEQGTAHEFSPDEARAAGRKGGVSVSKNRQHMSEIGRKGGEARGRKQGRGNGSAARENGAAPESNDNIKSASSDGAMFGPPNPLDVITDG
ncbi:MAG: general stress protein [Chthoniobacterales bacterium]|nr:general stress protein [Gemmatimonadaceae bacterium]MBA3831446.1 general stress protein [Chthoniobacterales bacterium]